MRQIVYTHEREYVENAWHVCAQSFIHSRLPLGGIDVIHLTILSADCLLCICAARLCVRMRRSFFLSCILSENSVPAVTCKFERAVKIRKIEREKNNTGVDKKPHDTLHELIELITGLYICALFIKPFDS